MEGFETQGFSFDLPKGSSSYIKVIGVGGGGNNALRHMYERGIHGVDFVICNTDAQTLDNNPVATKVQLGITMTEGLGAGADPEVGEKAALESIDDIKAALGQNTKMVFITAGMGGGTGTGAAPVIAKIAKEMGILTVAIVTVPFSFEGKRRLEQAEAGLQKLRGNVDSLIVINNDKLRQQFGNLGFKQGFAKADEVLTNAAKGMAEVITGYFDVNIDFRDAKSVLENSGTALMSTGVASGENKAEEAVKKALDSPLLNDNKITGAKNVLLLIRSGKEEATMDEIGIINDYIQREAGNTADIIFGVGSDEELGESISVLVIATGFSNDHLKHTGTTEKIRINLHDEVERPYRESPFKTQTEKQEESSSEEKTFIRLEDDEEDSTPKFKASGNENAALSEEQVLTEIGVFEEGHQGDNDEMNLFSYHEEEDDFEVQSFSFDLDETKENLVPSNEVESDEIKFTVSEPVQEPLKMEVQEEEIFTTNELAYNNVNSSADEVEQLANNVSTSTLENEGVEQDEFTFISKPTDKERKVQERRNKLKEFNTRYKVNDEVKEFETIPAFKRKNINLDLDKPSDSQNSFFVSEDEKGEIKISENRFLNKDVD